MSMLLYTDSVSIYKDSIHTHPPFQIYQLGADILTHIYNLLTGFANYAQILIDDYPQFCVNTRDQSI